MNVFLVVHAGCGEGGGVLSRSGLTATLSILGVVSRAHKIGLQLVLCPVIVVFEDTRAVLVASCER